MQVTYELHWCICTDRHVNPTDNCYFLDPLILFSLHRYNAVNEITEEWRKHTLYQSIQTEKFNLMFCIDHSNLYFVSNFFHLKTITSVISEKYNWIVSLHPKENVRSAMKHLTCHDDNVLWFSRSSGYLILKIGGSLKISLFRTQITMTSVYFLLQ